MVHNMEDESECLPHIILLGADRRDEPDGISSTVLQTAFAVKLGAYNQAGFDSTLCDVTEPLWPKLLGLGGLPLLYATGSAFFTAFAVRRLQAMLVAHRKLWHDITNQVEFAPRPGSDRKEMERVRAPDPIARRGEEMRLVSLSLDGTREEVRPSPGPVSPTPFGSTNNLTAEDSDCTRSPTPAPRPVDGDVSMYGTAPSKLLSWLEITLPLNSPTVFRTPTLPPPPTSLLREIWRLLLYQAAFISITALLTLSTLYSLTRHRRPREFGSDHIAGILASWAPVFVFGVWGLLAVYIEADGCTGHLPSIRRRLMFWKR
ncbi:hypothetical protein HWV62_6579 [Athelia sp. TMB]|nr:hypothetical protein HWV62_6579 [Athelia sp. TMB]